MAMVTQKTVVLVGHLNPMVELAKVFLRRGLSVIIAVVDSPDVMDRLAAANPDINFRRHPVSPCGKDHCSHPIMRTIDVLRVVNPALRDFLRTLPAVATLVVDMFLTDALDVAAELNIPAYLFFTSALGYLAIMLHLPYIFPTAPSSFKDMPETVLHFPGVPPIRAMDMAATMQDRESDIARARLHQCTRMPEARGFIVNSFDWLEARALKALRYGFCTHGRSTPPIYCIGPLVLTAKVRGFKVTCCTTYTL